MPFRLAPLTALVKARQLNHADVTGAIFSILSTNQIRVVRLFQVSLFGLHPGMKETTVIIPFNAYRQKIPERLLPEITYISNSYASAA
jgi:hypothetical protein